MSTSEQRPSLSHPDESGGERAGITTPLLRPTHHQISFVTGSISALIAFLWVFADGVSGRLYTAQVVILGIPLVAGLLGVYFAWLLHTGARLRRWMLHLVRVGYLGATLQFIIGAVMLYGAFSTSISDFRQPLMLLAGLAMMGCSAGLLLASEKIDTTVRRQTSRRSR